MGLIGTIKLPRNLVQITERLPKPQYNVMKRSESLPHHQTEIVTHSNNKSAANLRHEEIIAERKQRIQSAVNDKLSYDRNAAGGGVPSGLDII